MKPACSSKQALTGFSLNPHHAAGVDWQTVRARRPDARVLVWDRTNWVKKVASAVLFEQKGCRHHNIRTTREARRCHHRKPTTISEADFLGRVRGEACDSATLYALGAAFANDTQVVVATYEAFRNDAGAELTRVFRELGLDASAARKTPPRTMKRSPEALSRVFANHKDLARALKRWAPKGCRLEGMILDTKGTKAFRCNAARACDHFRELERACRGGGEC